MFLYLNNLLFFHLNYNIPQMYPLHKLFHSHMNLNNTHILYILHKLSKFLHVHFHSNHLDTDLSIHMVYDHFLNIHIHNCLYNYFLDYMIHILLSIFLLYYVLFYCLFFHKLYILPNDLFHHISLYIYVHALNFHYLLNLLHQF